MKNFYKKLLPSQGVYCVMSINGNTRNHFCDTLESMEEMIDVLVASNSNVFFALSSFNNYSRKADNALYSRSFFVDLDVGEGKGYASKDQALLALQFFLEATQLPPPVIVDSGNGIHAYWPFDRDVPVDEWAVYADKFKRFCLDSDLHIDPVVTADVSRVLRCPGSFNHKSTPAIPVVLLSPAEDDICEYDFDAFKEFLGISEKPSEVTLAPYTDSFDDGSLAVAKRDENFEYVFADIAIQSLQGNGCNQIKHIIEEARNLPEPLWYAGLSIAVRCVDGEQAIHDMSQDYEGYSREETIRKANQSLREATWAHGCDAFARENPAGCEGCPRRGKFSSPIWLGRRLKTEEAPAPQGKGQESERPSSGQKDGAFFPEDIRPFARGVSGGIYYLPPVKQDKKGNPIQDDPILVFENDILPIKRIIGGPDGDVLQVRNVTPRDPTNEFQLPVRCVYAVEELKRTLPENGVYPLPNAIPYAALYFFKWATFLQNNEAAEIMRMQMGWTENREAFVIGAAEITKQGERPAAVSHMVRNVSKITKRAGSYDLWRKSAQGLNYPGWEQQAFGLLCGLGSPLMTYSPVSGATVCFMSSESGQGKTASLYAGLSVFCNPKEISVLEGNATENALTGRYLAMKNMMFGIDEVSNIEAETLSKIIHKISQGKAKMRMQSSVNAERELEQTASLIAFFTSNKDLYDVLRTFKGSPDGEMARLVQIALRKPKQLIDTPEVGPQIIDPLRENYGHAGPMLIEYIFQKGEDHVKVILQKWRARWEKDFSNKTEYRHYVAALSSAFAAGELSNEAGIIDFDLERIYKVLLVDLIQLRDKTVKLNTTNYKSLVSEFIHRYHAGFLIFNEGRVISEPRTELVGRIEVDHKVQYISKSSFKKFLAGLQISAAEFEKAMEKENMMVDTKKVRLSSGWKAGMVTPAISVYALKADIPEEILSVEKT